MKLTSISYFVFFGIGGSALGSYSFKGKRVLTDAKSHLAHHLSRLLEEKSFPTLIGSQIWSLSNNT